MAQIIVDNLNMVLWHVLQGKSSDMGRFNIGGNVLKKSDEGISDGGWHSDDRFKESVSVCRERCTERNRENSDSVDGVSRGTEENTHLRSAS